MEEYSIGEYIIYRNGEKYELGRIKSLREDGAFVAYHEGETGAKTPYDCMHKLINGYCIKETLLGGDYFRAEQTEPQSDVYDYCPRCGMRILSKWAKTEPTTQTETQNSNKNSNVISVYDGVSETEPQTEHLEQFRVGLEYHTDTTHFGKTKYDSVTTNKIEAEPQTNADHHAQHIGSVETMSCQECKRWIYDDRWGWFCPLKSQDECRYEPKTEPQTEKPKIRKRIDKPFRAVWLDDDHNEIGTPQTDCSWK